MPCSKCSNKNVVNQKHQLCNDCNYVRIHGVTRMAVAIEKSRNRPIKRKVKRKGTKKRVRWYEKDNALNRRKLDENTYFEVFISNPDECQECKAKLNSEFYDDQGEILNVWQYSHILSKGSHPQYRNNPKNFNRLCFKHHQQWEFGKDRESMNIYKNNQIIIQQLYDSTFESGS